MCVGLCLQIDCVDDCVLFRERQHENHFGWKGSELLQIEKENAAIFVLYSWKLLIDLNQSIDRLLSGSVVTYEYLRSDGYKIE